MDKNLVTLIIDGKEARVPEGTLIVEAAKSIGIEIPVFCYHPKLEPAGMCRMCLVEVGRPLIDRANGQAVLDEKGSPKIQFSPKLETACTTPVSPGMVVVSVSDKVKAARKEVIEFILTSHPLDCPVCDKGGECPLQNLTMAHGAGQSRFIYNDKKHLQKRVPLGDLIILDRERCIQCGRCVRFQSEVAGDPVIGFYHRGRSLEIVTFSEPGFDSYFSGNTTDICPVGALTSTDFRFGARPWEMKTVASLCSHCPVGCNLVFNVRQEAKSGGKTMIKRVMPRQNESVNGDWICDKGRFGYHFSEGGADRLTQPLMRKDGLIPVSWEDALQAIADRFQAAGKEILTLAGGRLANEDLFNIKELAAGLGGVAALHSHMAGGDLVARFGVGQGTHWDTIGAGTAILIVASDLEEEAPIWWLRVRQAVRRGATLIVANPRPTKCDAIPDVPGRQPVDPAPPVHLLRYKYGREAAVIQALIDTLSPGSSGETSSSDSAGGLPAQAEIKAAAAAFAAAPNALILYGSEGIGLAASRTLAQACANLLLLTRSVGGSGADPNRFTQLGVVPNSVGRANAGKEHLNGLIAVWGSANEQGAWDMGLRPLDDLNAAIAAARAIYIVGADPAGDDPAMASALDHAVQAGAFLVVQELFLTKTARLADIVLPAQAYTERSGTFTSGEQLVQRYYPVVPANPADAAQSPRADFEITAEIGKRLNLDLEGGSPERVMTRIVAKVKNYAVLGHSPYRALAAQPQPLNNLQPLDPARIIQTVPLAEQPQGDPKSASVVPNTLLAVPVTILYDRGRTLLPSTEENAAFILRSRIPSGPYLRCHPEDALRLGLAQVKSTRQVKNTCQVKNTRDEKEWATQCVQIELDGVSVLAALRADSNVPQGILLVPRSLGIACSRPTPVRIVAAKEKAA